MCKRIEFDLKKAESGLGKLYERLNLNLIVR